MSDREGQNYGREGTYEERYDHPIRAIRKDVGENIMVRIMDKDEMPDDGTTYYADTDCSIYTIEELELKGLDRIKQLKEELKEGKDE